MPKRTFSIEFDIPHGYDVVAYDRPKEGQSYFAHGEVQVATHNFRYGYFPILQKTWEWPEWLTATYIAMDSDGSWWAYGSEPEMGFNCYQSSNKDGCILRFMTGLPSIDRSNWESSLIRNPNAS